MILFKNSQKPTRWFAWHPVPLDGEKGEHYQAWVWLQFVWRDRTSYKYPWSYALNEKTSS